MMRSLLLLALVLIPTAQVSAQGLIIEEAQDLQGTAEAPGFRGTLPATVDLTEKIPPPRSQADTSTCTSWAATYAAASQALRRAGKPKALTLSPSFTYNQVAGDPYCQSGSTISRTLDLLRDKGSLPIEEFGFDAGWCGRVPKAAELERAAEYRIRGWSQFKASDIEATKAQLARGVPVVFGMRVGAKYSAYKGGAVFDSDSDAIFGHSMVAVGYDDGRKAVRIQNSRGKGWGDSGYAWFSYEFWKRIQVGFVID